MPAPLTPRQEYLSAVPTRLFGAVVAPISIPAPTRMNAVVVDHWDGDSFYVRLAVGINNLEIKKQLIRIIGCAARERSDPGGIEAREALKARPGMTVGSPVVLTALTDDKFGGRLDAVVTYRSSDGTPRDLAADLIAEQWAVPWNGSGIQPKPPWPRTVL